ncbi:MAG: class I SAM-dependent methyltransferase [Candidatus Bathyarchaeia archaeon]|jgi:2-polyprenyl-3-methyl-5-hydroxy-6-metoxy-1,4-benzoquinol methylase
MSDYNWDSDYVSGDFRHWEPNSSSPELAALVAAGLLRKTDKILDVGCGGGLDAIFMARCGFKLAGVDLSRKALKIAKARADAAQVKVDWVLGSVFDLPLESQTFDLVTDRGLFHLIEDADRSRFSSEVFRVLKPRGHMLIRGASIETGQERFNPVTDEAVDRFFPKNKWSRGALVPTQLFSIAGSIDARIVFLKKRGLYPVV